MVLLTSLICIMQCLHYITVILVLLQLELMQKTAKEKGFDLVALMLTDVLLEGTQLIYVGKDDIIQQAFSVAPKDSTVFLPRVMSRKKQVIPMLSALWG